MSMSKSVVSALRSAVKRGECELSEGGVLMRKLGILAKGCYVHTVNGKDEQRDSNMIPDAAILDILGVYWGGGAPPAAWYMALFAGAVTPANTWTANNFAATATEITSNTEGYASLTRPQWAPGPPAGGNIGNLTNKAPFTIATASQLTINGAGLLSNNTKGGTAGILSSAARFANPRVLSAGDVFELGYVVTLNGA